jgi:hypothetical protein
MRLTLTIAISPQRTEEERRTPNVRGTTRSLIAGKERPTVQAQLERVRRKAGGVAQIFRSLRAQPAVRAFLTSKGSRSLASKDLSAAKAND